MNLVERNLIIKYIVYAMYYNVQYLYAYEHSNVFQYSGFPLFNIEICKMEF